MILRKNTDCIVIHCAATKPSMDIGADEIRKWHKEERGFDDIGYHYVIKRNGEYEIGRPLAFQGAHAVAVNGRSIGVCLIGGLSENNQPENNFTLEQFLTLKDVIEIIKRQYPHIKEIIGHCDVEAKKPHCPGFNVQEWLNKEDIKCG